MTMTHLIKEVLHQSHLAIYAEVSLVMFLAIFAIGVWRALHHSKGQMEHMASLPMEDD